MNGRDQYGRRILFDGHQPIGKKPPIPKRFKSAVMNPSKVIVAEVKSNMKFYHGSSELLKNGSILKRVDKFTSRPEKYEVILENLRPKHAFSRHNAVFLASNVDDLDSLGAAMDYVYEVEPLTVVEKHDLTWISEIEMALEESNEALADNYAKNYWKGIPSSLPLWEFLTSKAKILSLVEQNA